MLKQELEQNKNLFMTDYEDMDLYAEALCLGAKAWKVNIENNTVEEMIVSAVFRKSEDSEYNQKDYLDEYDEEYDVSGEFITDNDCCYVFFKYK